MTTPQKGPIPISLPDGKPVSCTLVVQSSLEQTFTIRDKDNNTIVTMSGSGGIGGPKFIGEQSFVAKGDANPYTVEIKTPSGPEGVLVAEAATAWGATIYARTWTFASEDATDNDFNDSFATVTWFRKSG
jgi:hypothetical protein